MNEYSRDGTLRASYIEDSGRIVEGKIRGVKEECAFIVWD
jgi:hypothetical protein